MQSLPTKLELLAKELCRIRYPNEKKPGECLYVWELMSDDHKQMFIDSAKCAIRFVVKELYDAKSWSDFHAANLIQERIDELRQISA